MKISDQVSPQPNYNSPHSDLTTPQSVKTTPQHSKSILQPEQSTLQAERSNPQPVESSSQKVESPSQKVESPSQKVESPPQKVESPPQKVESPPQTVESQPRPVESPPQPVESPPQPVESPPQPVESPPQPRESQSQPMESPPQPVESPPQPVKSPPQTAESLPQTAEFPHHAVEFPPQAVESPPQPMESPPQPLESSPQPLESSPQPLESPPQLKETTPQLEETTPQLEKNTPQLEETTSQHEETTSQHEETTPQREETSPQREETTPQHEETTPRREETTRQREETIRQRVETTPYREETTPQSEEVTPQSEETTPQSEEPTPQTEEPTPQTEEPTPQTEEPTPQTEEPTPQTEEPTPQTEEPTPQTEEPTPQTEEPTPQTEEPTPQSEGPTPQSEGPTPQSEEPTPQSEEPTPQSEEPTPQSEEPTPQSEEPTPQSEEPTPQSEEPTPQSEEPTPHCEEPTPHNEETTHQHGVEMKFVPALADKCNLTCVVKNEPLDYIPDEGLFTLPANFIKHESLDQPVKQEIIECSISAVTLVKSEVLTKQLFSANCDQPTGTQVSVKYDVKLPELADFGSLFAATNTAKRDRFLGPTSGEGLASSTSSIGQSLTCNERMLFEAILQMIPSENSSTSINCHGTSAVEACLYTGGSPSLDSVQISGDIEELYSIQKEVNALKDEADCEILPIMQPLQNYLKNNVKSLTYLEQNLSYIKNILKAMKIERFKSNDLSNSSMVFNSVSSPADGFNSMTSYYPSSHPLVDILINFQKLSGISKSFNIVQNGSTCTINIIKGNSNVSQLCEQIFEKNISEVLKPFEFPEPSESLKTHSAIRTCSVIQYMSSGLSATLINPGTYIKLVNDTPSLFRMAEKNACSAQSPPATNIQRKKRSCSASSDQEESGDCVSPRRSAKVSKSARCVERVNYTLRRSSRTMGNSVTDANVSANSGDNHSIFSRAELNDTLPDLDVAFPAINVSSSTSQEKCYTYDGENSSEYSLFKNDGKAVQKITSRVTRSSRRNGSQFNSTPSPTKHETRTRPCTRGHQGTTVREIDRRLGYSEKRLHSFDNSNNISPARKKKKLVGKGSPDDASKKNSTDSYEKDNNSPARKKSKLVGKGLPDGASKKNSTDSNEKNNNSPARKKNEHVGKGSPDGASKKNPTDSYEKDNNSPARKKSKLVGKGSPDGASRKNSTDSIEKDSSPARKKRKQGRRPLAKEATDSEEASSSTDSTNPCRSKVVEDEKTDGAVMELVDSEQEEMDLDEEVEEDFIRKENKVIEREKRLLMEKVKEYEEQQQMIEKMKKDLLKKMESIRSTSNTVDTNERDVSVPSLAPFVDPSAHTIGSSHNKTPSKTVDHNKSSNSMRVLDEQLGGKYQKKHVDLGISEKASECVREIIERNEPIVTDIIDKVISEMHAGSFALDPGLEEDDDDLLSHLECLSDDFETDGVDEAPAETVEAPAVIDEYFAACAPPINCEPIVLKDSRKNLAISNNSQDSFSPKRSSKAPSLCKSSLRFFRNHSESSSNDSTDKSAASDNCDSAAMLVAAAPRTASLQPSSRGFQRRQVESCLPLQVKKRPDVNHPTNFAIAQSTNKGHVIRVGNQRGDPSISETVGRSSQFEETSPNVSNISTTSSELRGLRNLQKERVLDPAGDLLSNAQTHKKIDAGKSSICALPELIKSNVNRPSTQNLRHIRGLTFSSNGSGIAGVRLVSNTANGTSVCSARDPTSSADSTSMGGARSSTSIAESTSTGGTRGPTSIANSTRMGSASGPTSIANSTRMGSASGPTSIANSTRMGSASGPTSIANSTRMGSASGPTSIANGTSMGSARGPTSIANSTSLTSARGPTSSASSTSMGVSSRSTLTASSNSIDSAKGQTRSSENGRRVAGKNGPTITGTSMGIVRGHNSTIKSNSLGTGRGNTSTVNNTGNGGIRILASTANNTSNGSVSSPTCTSLDERQGVINTIGADSVAMKNNENQQGPMAVQREKIGTGVMNVQASIANKVTVRPPCLVQQARDYDSDDFDEDDDDDTNKVEESRVVLGRVPAKDDSVYLACKLTLLSETLRHPMLSANKSSTRVPCLEVACDDVTLFCCPECYYQTNCRFRYRIHYYVHSYTQYKCMLCDYSTTSREKTLQHEIRHGTDDEMTCEICNYVCFESKSLVRHRKIHLEATEKDPRCRKCPYEGRNFMDIRRHGLLEHGIKGLKIKLECLLCPNQRFPGFRSLGDHVTSHMTSNGEYKCSQCAFSDPDQMVMQDHVRLHSKVPYFQCDLCTFQANSRKQLVEHLDVHRPPQHLKCTFCKHIAADKHELEQHLVTHSNETYSCNICEFVSFSLSDLLNHKKRLHLNIGSQEPEVSCPVCTVFKTRRNCDMKKHLLMQHDFHGDRLMSALNKLYSAEFRRPQNANALH